MNSEVAERIHKALESHPLEKIDQGYRLNHAAGTSTLRLLPARPLPEATAGATAGAMDNPLLGIAQIDTEYRTGGFPAFHAAGLQRLNAMSVHGAYYLAGGRLRQSAQFSLYTKESAVHLATQSILNAFGGQLPIGRSTALGTASAAALEQQRAHHGLPRAWQKPIAEEALKATETMLRERGLAAAHGPDAVWAEFVLSGECPSRSIDPNAETALLQVHAGLPHPVAGVGYLATISLPLTKPPGDPAEICRRLNALELLQEDFIPRVGAWGLHGPNDLPGYSCFIPAAEPFGDFHTTMMWWCALRAAWIRDRYWAPASGLDTERIMAAA